MSSNGNGVKSVSLADGTLSPDQRVNYNFGLVLGVNEFKQEQEYFLQKDYLYNRAFEGYGTVSGLRVTAEWLKGEDVQISVDAGMAIDQLGKPIIIREAQCARLVPWLKKQEQQTKGTIEAHRTKSKKEKKEAQKQHEEQDDERDLRIYVIAKYKDCAVGQVPIARQACNTGDTAPIYSRLQDSFDIALSWDAPTMPAWESMRCFAKMMARVRIKDNAERDDTAEIIERLRKLEEPGSVPLCTPPKKHKDDDDDEHDDTDAWDDEDGDDKRKARWFIPTDQARTALDSIFTIWATEVRPRLLPDLLDPEQAGTLAQPEILLASIDFTLDDDWDDNDPKIEEDGFDAPDNGGRPYLLPMQVVQEMLLLGHRESHGGGGGGNAQPVSEFATIQVRNSHTLCVWVHHPRRLEIEGEDEDWSEVLEVRSDGQSLKIKHVKELEPNVFEIRVKPSEEQEGEGILMVPGARVELVFKVDEIPVERGDDDDQDDEEDADEGEHKQSGDLEDKVEEGVEEVGEVVGDVVGGTGDVLEEAAGGIEELAGGIVKGVGEGLEALEHAVGLGKEHKTLGERVEHVGEEVIHSGDELITEAQADEKRLDRKEQEDAKEDAKDDKEEGAKEEHELSLARSIGKGGLNYVGYDDEQKAIIVYTIASHIPIRELVTFFTYDQRTDMANVPHEELKKVTTAEHFLALWFHTTDPVRLPEQVRGWRVFVNQQPQELLFKAMPPEKQTFSYFWALEPVGNNGTLKLEPGELLTLSFNTDEIGVGGDDAVESLTEVMKEEPFSCVGYDGNHTIEVHHQVSPSHGRGGDEEITITDKLAVSQETAQADRTLPATQPFVTISVTRLNQGAEGIVEAYLELWFHLATNAEQNRDVFSENVSFDVLLEDGARMQTIAIPATAPTRVQSNVYTSMVTLPPPRTEQRGYYLRLRFALEQNGVNVRGVAKSYKDLGEFISGTGIRFEGYNGDNAIIAYVRVAVPGANTRQATETAK